MPRTARQLAFDMATRFVHKQRHVLRLVSTTIGSCKIKLLQGPYPKTAAKLEKATQDEKAIEAVFHELETVFLTEEPLTSLLPRIEGLEFLSRQDAPHEDLADFSRRLQVVREDLLALCANPLENDGAKSVMLASLLETLGLWSDQTTWRSLHYDGKAAHEQVRLFRDWLDAFVQGGCETVDMLLMLGGEVPIREATGELNDVYTELRFIGDIVRVGGTLKELTYRLEAANGKLVQAREWRAQRPSILTPAESKFLNSWPEWKRGDWSTYVPVTREGNVRLRSLLVQAIGELRDLWSSLEPSLVAIAQNPHDNKTLHENLAAIGREPFAGHRIIHSPDVIGGALSNRFVRLASAIAQLWAVVDAGSLFFETHDGNQRLLCITDPELAARPSWMIAPKADGAS